jgi:hypothetical protein
MAKILENIKGQWEYEILKAFIQKIDFSHTVKSTYAPKRLEKWFGYASNLQSIKDGRHAVGFTEDIPDIFNRIKNQYYQDADSLLVCYGNKPESDTTIANHRDHGTFLAKAVMINFGEATYSETDYDGRITKYDLQDGDVVEIDTKIIHAAYQLSDLRINATFRKFRPEYLPKKTNSLF